MEAITHALGRRAPVRFFILTGLFSMLCLSFILPQPVFAVEATLSTTRAKYRLTRIRPNRITHGGQLEQQTADWGDASSTLSQSWATVLSPVDPGVSTSIVRNKGYVWRLLFPNNATDGWTSPNDPVLSPTGDYHITYSIVNNPGELGSTDTAFPSAKVNVTMETRNLRIRRRNNGRLRDIRGGIKFTLGMDATTNASGFYDGDISIEITSPNGSITIN